MQAAAHLLLALSGHGFGHLAQSAPVINAMWEKLPSLKVTVCSSLPRDVIAGRLEHAFECRMAELDVVMPMASAWEVDAPGAARAWSAFHRNLEAGTASDLELLGSLKPDLLLADIPYRILAAARRAGVPAVALCSLNWASIYSAYCRSAADSEMVAAQMWDAYRAADVFLAPEPAMQMPQLPNYRPIGPIARAGRQDRATLQRLLDLPETARIVLVALGGIDSRLPLANWPCIDGVSWLFPAPVESERDDLLDFGRLPLDFIDVLASADAVLTKPGYGTYAEAVCNGVPLLSLARDDWPETAGLNAWARTQGRFQELDIEAFQAGSFAPALQRLWAQPAPPTRPLANGIQQAADVLLEKLTSGVP